MLNKVSNYRDLSHSFLLCITSVVKEWETLDAFCIPDYLFSVTFIRKTVDADAEFFFYFENLFLKINIQFFYDLFEDDLLPDVSVWQVAPMRGWGTVWSNNECTVYC